jgi:transcriptional regulator with XRE-family HTH domain
VVTVLDNIKRFAKLRGLSLAEVAERAGISRASIYTWDKRQPTSSALAAVAEVLGVAVADLLKATRYASPAATATPATLPASGVDLAALLSDESTTLLYKGRRLDDRDRQTVERVLDR